MRRRLAVVIALVGVAASLVACTPPTADSTAVDAAVDAWNEAAVEADAGRDDLLGGSYGQVTEEPEGSLVILGYTLPTRVTGFEAACIDNGRVEVGWEIRSGSSYVTGGEIVECTGDPVPIPLESAVSAVDEVRWSVIRRDGSPTAYRSSVIGESAE